MSHLEIICFDGNEAIKTGMGAAGATNAESWALWKDAQPLAKPLMHAPFALDYYNRRGDLFDTIGLDRAGVELLTGKKPRSPAHYRKADAKFWKAERAKIQRQREASK